jgi:putative membrane protein
VDNDNGSFAVVTLVSELTTHKLVVSNQLLTVLGTVLGLVISFRTSSAYERCVLDTWIQKARQY